MVTKPKRFFRALLPLLSAMLLFADSEARPVRVGMFRGIGTGGVFWHTNIHTANTVMAEILANPAAAGLGDSLVIPKDGFLFHSMPIAPSTGGGDCTGSNCGPTAEQLAAIVKSLDTLDVLILNSTTRIGNRIMDSAQRRAFETFWRKKGFVSVHATVDSYGEWPGLDSANGARFRGMLIEQNGKVRLDSVYEAEPDWRFLNKGLFSSGRDTTFFEEWMYFIESGATLRSRAHVKPTLKLEEASLSNPGSLPPMGDHPLSWYRELPTGGRTFYTALGHRSQVWQTARTFRRQVYNAVLWAARVDSAGVVSLRREQLPPAGPAMFALRAEKGHLHFASDYPARVSVRTADGRLVSRRSGSGTMRFPLPSGALYLVTVQPRDGAPTSQRMILP